MIGRVLGMLVFALPTMALASEASFDCRRAQTPIEVAICSTDELADADAELGRVFRRAVVDRPAVRAEQVRWIRERNAKCGADPACLVQTIRGRTVELEATLAQSSDRARDGNTTESRSTIPQVTDADGATALGAATPRDSRTSSSPLAGVFVIPALSKCDAPGANGYFYSVISGSGQLSSEEWVQTSSGWLPPTTTVGTRFIARGPGASGATIFEEVRPNGSRCLAQLVVAENQVLFGPEIADSDVPSCGASMQGTLVGKPFLVRCAGIPGPLVELRRIRAEESSRIERALTRVIASEDLYQWARNSFLLQIKASCRFTPPVSDKEWLDLNLSSAVDEQRLNELLPMDERVYVARAGDVALKGCPSLADVRFGRTRLQIAPEAFLYQKRLRGWVDEDAVRITSSSGK